VENMSFKSEAFLKSEFGIDESVLRISNMAEKEIENLFKSIESVREYNQLKVIKAMQSNKVSDSHFGGTTGYGYDDRGREVLDSVYAHVFRAEDALVRHNIVSGTQALAVCLFGNLRPGDELYV
jgi:cystathionine beta-lyase family protein involved in aluminum resistance